MKSIIHVPLVLQIKRGGLLRKNKSTGLVITCIVAFGEAGDEVMSISLGGGLHHHLDRDVTQPVGDVLLNGPGKQHRLLAHQSNLQTQK